MSDPGLGIIYPGSGLYPVFTRVSDQDLVNLNQDPHFCSTKIPYESGGEFVYKRISGMQVIQAVSQTREKSE